MKKLITVYATKSPFLMVRIGYLQNVTPAQLAEALEEIVWCYGDFIVIVTDDAVPCAWACSMVVAACIKNVSMVAIDTRDNTQESCTVVGISNKVSQSNSWLLGQHFASPDLNPAARTSEEQ